MPELAEIKASTHDSGPFSETVKFKVLHCGNVEGNNNKFFCLEIQKNPNNGALRLFSHYGRLGKTNTFGIRDGVKEGCAPITDLSFAEKVFESIIAKKTKGKKIKDEDGQDRIEKYEEVNTVRPTVGSTNIRDKVLGEVKVEIKKSQQIDKSSFDPIVSKLIDQIIAENIHNITSVTSLKLTANGFETPLGPVTKEHVQKAREPLNILKSLLKNGKLDEDSKEVKTNNNLFFSLIPHPFGHKITIEDWILNDTKLSEEFEMLDNLESAVNMGSALQQNSQQKANALGTDVEVLKDRAEWDRIKNYIEKSKAPNHRGSDVWNYRVKCVFKIRIPNERKRFETRGQSMGCIKELFHGSKNCNILSILKNGLIIPGCNCPTFSGRMFGDGIYLASASTKSLNYSTNFWNRSHANKFDNIFLFLADAAMGKYYEARSSMSGGIPRGYDSIWAKAGSGLYNDEFIVGRLEQQTITYLVEMIK